MKVYKVYLGGYGENLVAAFNETHAIIKLYLKFKKGFKRLKYSDYKRKYVYKIEIVSN